jgi:hypothetical protein
LDGTKRVMRRFGAALAVMTWVITGWAAPASAHDAVILTLHGDGRGSVWLTARWQDGHPMTEPAGVVLTATSQAGQRIGPVGLCRAGTALTYPDTLPAGEWAVVADMGTPAIGRCAATLIVASAAPSPSSHRCEASPEPAAVQAVSTSSQMLWYSLSALSILAVGIAALMLVRRRRTAARPARVRRTGTRYHVHNGHRPR